MTVDRRALLLGSLATAVLATAAKAAPASVRGLDAAQFGLHPGAPDDQSAKLQRAIDQAARTRLPLWLAPGVYRAGDLTLPAGAHLAGMRGASRVVLTHGSLLSAQNAEFVTLSGLVLDGGGQKLSENRALEIGRAHV